MKTAREIIVAALDPALRNGLAENRAARIIDNLKGAGFVILPTNPTEAMVRAAQMAIPAGHGQAWTYAAQAYAAMLKAAE